MISSIPSKSQFIRTWATLHLLIGMSQQGFWEPRWRRSVAELETLSAVAVNGLFKKRKLTRETAEKSYAAEQYYLNSFLNIKLAETSGQVCKMAVVEALVALFHMETEVKITCPMFTVGQAWMELDRLIFSITKRIDETFPQYIPGGVAKYEQLAAHWDETI